MFAKLGIFFQVLIISKCGKHYLIETEDKVTVTHEKAANGSDYTYYPYPPPHYNPYYQYPSGSPESYQL